MSNPTSDSVRKILILGGYGNTGRPLARLLLQYTNIDGLVLAGRTLSRAQALADELNQTYSGNRVSSRMVDASSFDTLIDAFQDVDLVLVASSTAQHVQNVALAALQAKIDYYDIQYCKKKEEYLQTIASDIESAGLCFITDGGFHPGLPAALIRYVAPCFERMETAHVGSVIQLDWAGLDNISPETIEELASEFADLEMLEYKDGTWNDAGLLGMMNPREMDFGEPFGKRYCFPMFLEEMRSIPTLYPELLQTGFYVGGLNWAVDWFISPIVMLGIKLWPTRRMKLAMGRLLHWGMRTFSRPPFGTLLKVEANGIDKEDGLSPLVKVVTVKHDDGYELTAIPVAATLLQYLQDEEKSIRKPGLWFQANLVDPAQLMDDMCRMGVEIHPPLT